MQLIGILCFRAESRKTQHRNKIGQLSLKVHLFAKEKFAR